MSDEITTHEQPQVLGWEVIGSVVGGNKRVYTGRRISGRRYFTVKTAADEYCRLVKVAGHPEAEVREVIGFEGRKP